MKFWLLTSEFPPSYGGGISTYCSETVNMLLSEGHEVTVFVQDFSVKKIKEETKDGFRAVRFNPSNFYTAAFLGYEANLSYAFAEVVKSYIQKEGEPAVIESQEYLGIAYFLLLYKHLQYPLFKNLKVVLTLHSPSFLYLEYNKVIFHKLPYYWVGEMEKFCIKAADLLISPSRYLIEEIRTRVDISNAKIHIVNNPYSVNWPYTESKITPEKIVFFGKLTPQKGCLELIEYFKSLWNDGLRYKLTMIGGGNHLYHPEGIDMIDFIRKKYHNEIKSGLLQLLGSISPDKLFQHLTDAHVVVVPSVVDNLPYVVLEAMGRGKIVLASQQGGQAEVIGNGTDGFIFDHEQAFSFQSQFKKILNLNEAEISQVSRNAYQKIKNNYDPKAVYRAKLDLLNNLINNTNDIKAFPYIRPVKNIQNQQVWVQENEPLLSVIIPYYNMGAFVEETIASLKNAHYKNLEIILVNDGSNDPESVDKLNSLEQQYKVNIVHQRNQGLAVARNTGALKATGDYIAFLDPDDTVEPEYYTKAIEVLKKFSNVHFVGCWARYFGGNKGYWPSFNPEPPYLLIHNMLNTSALVYKKQAFLNGGLNNKLMIFGMEDYESVINLVKNGYQGVALPEPLWNYRIRKNSMARQFTRDKQLYLYRLMANMHATFYGEYASEVANLLNANGPGINYDNPTQLYDFPSGFIGQRLKQRIVMKIKSTPGARKVAMFIKKFF